MISSVARWILRRLGWEIEGEPPRAGSYVLVAAPHTSNWDLAYFLAITRALGVRPRFMAKHTLFRPPLGWLLRALGGISIRRDRRANVVEQVAAELQGHPGTAVTIAVEGTRGRAGHWKSGFYHIARRAGVPVVLGFLDYPRRRGGFGPAIELSGDIGADMERIRAFYADKRGRHPDLAGEIRLREEAQGGG